MCNWARVETKTKCVSCQAASAGGAESGAGEADVRVRCVSEKVSDELAAAMGPGFAPHQVTALTTGREYLVLELFFATGDEPFGTGTWVVIPDDHGRFGEAPLPLFEVTDPRVSRYWELQRWPNGNVTLGPAVFGRDFFVDDLFEGVPAAAAEFRRVYQLLDSEFGSH